MIEGERSLALARNRRVLGLGATALVLAAGLALGLVLRGPAPGEVRALENPGSVAQKALRDVSTSSCYQRAIIDYYLPPTFALADELADVDRWLAEGTHYAFVGDLAVGAAELGGRLAGITNREAWILTADAAGPVLYGYDAFTTPKGRTLWMLVSVERPQSEAACS